jgi:Reverse transcriptase (RNA-dependent DNA polymerase)
MEYQTAIVSVRHGSFEHFFHAFASARSTEKVIVALQTGDTTINTRESIQEAFFQHLKLQLSTEAAVSDFDPTALYPQQHNLQHLDRPFTIIEIERAVRQLARNKASGTDGLPNEFIQAY